MSARHTFYWVLAVVALLAVPVLVEAAEIRLKAQCEPQGPLVTLGDIATIYSDGQGQAGTLAAMELFPAPSAARQRYLGLREIQDLLLLRGVNLAEHRFSGSNQVAIFGRQSEPSLQNEPLDFSAERRANRRVCEAVARYLQQSTSQNVDWIVQLQLSPEQARLAADPTRAISAVGGNAQWVGQQRFQISVESSGGPVQFTVDATVSMPPEVVVTVRALPRGALVQPTDVELRRAGEFDDAMSALRSIDDVVGKETVRAVGQGKLLTEEELRAPLLVRRGDVVTVYARSPGITVRTNARARDDGSQGDLIAVESLGERQRFFARVSGIRQVEVYARSQRATESSAFASSGATLR